MTEPGFKQKVNLTLKKRGSLIAWLIALFFGFLIVIFCLEMAPYVTSSSDPFALTRWVLQTVVALTLFFLFVTGGLIFLDTYTQGEWFEDITNGNWQVTAITCSIILVLGLVAMSVSW